MTLDLAVIQAAAEQRGITTCIDYLGGGIYGLVSGPVMVGPAQERDGSFLGRAGDFYLSVNDINGDAVAAEELPGDQSADEIAALMAHHLGRSTPTPTESQDSMTNATFSTSLAITHRFTVPDGAAASDLTLALHWATSKAKELGIDTTYDDWFRIETNEECMSFVITETKLDVNLDETITLDALIAKARSLTSEDGENAEYDRALVELVASATPGDNDLARARASHQILGTPGA